MKKKVYPVYHHSIIKLYNTMRHTFSAHTSPHILCHILYQACLRPCLYCSTCQAGCY